MKLLTRVAIIFDRFNDFLVVVAGVLVIFAMLSLCLEVIMRYFLNSPLAWEIPANEIILVYITFLCTAWLLKKEKHVKMDMVVNRLQPRAQTLLNIITSVIGMFSCLILFWYGAQVTWSHFQRSVVFAGTDIPTAPVFVIVPVGGFLLFIQFLRRTYGHWVRGRTSEIR